MKKHLEIAVYGKGGIGKSTISANLTAAAAMKGNRVLQIGCDPKHDSTRLLMHGTSIPTVLDVLRDKGEDRMRPEDILKHSSLDAANGQIDCIEAGGPKPGVGCAGRGIISAFEYLNRNHIREQYDYVVYDVLGDVVCGGFAVPVRREYADAVFLVTSGEYMALYAANNILRGIRNFDGDRYQRVAGIIFNERKLEDEDGRVRRFAEAVGLPVLARVPRSEAFARAEEVNRTVMEQPGFEEEKRVFRKLADLLTGDMKLYPANPLTDEEHERIVLGRKEAQTFGRTEAEVNGFAAERSGDATALTGLASAKLSGGKNASNAESAAAAVSESAGVSIASETETAKLSSYTDSLDSGSSPNTFTRPPLYGCAFNGAASSAVHLTDAIVIAHGPKACAFYTMQTISSPGKKNIFNRGVLLPASISPNFVSTNIGHAEAVFGGIDLLRSAVQKAMAKKPGAVIVVSTCVSGIIGDDLCSVEALSTEEIPVIAIAADGDMNGDYMEGIKMAQEILADRLIRKDLPKSDRCVNIIGEAGIASNTASNYAVMERLLNAMGIRINCRFLGNATVDEVRNFTRAPLNILASDSPDTVRLKDYLVRNYGCAFLEAPLPVGFQATKNWLMGIAAFFGCEEEAEKLIEAEERTYQEKVAFLRSRLEGKKVFLTTINANLDWLLDTAYDVGLDFVYIGVHNYLRTPLSISVHPDRQEKAEEIQDPAKTRELIRRLKPEILLSAYTPETEEEHMITDTLPMIPDLGMMSAAEIMERWIRLMNTKRKGEWEHDRKLFEKYFR